MRPQHEETSVRRAPVLLALAVLLVAGGLADRVIRRPRARQPARIESQIPMVAPASARSSAWFCTGASGGSASPADGTVVVANTTDRPLAGTVGIVAIQGAPRSVAITVAPSSRATVRLAEGANSPWFSAVVELDGGGAAVELATSGPLGSSVTPCASSASPSWYFASGVTTKDASETLLVFNPFPEDAVVDFAFATSEGLLTPEGLTGKSVPGRGMVAINVGEFVQRRDAVASSVIARTGRLVAARVQTFDGTGGVKGVSVATGAAGVGPQWSFPEGVVNDAVIERFSLFNPGTVEAEVEITLALETGQAEPIQVLVPAQSQQVLVANAETRIPKGVPHAVTVRAGTGSGVVVERTVINGPPSGRLGIASAFGSRLASRRWAVAAGQADDGTDEWVVVANPAAVAARVSVVILADGDDPAPPGLTDVVVPAGGRKALRINDHLKAPATAMLITADQLVTVERDLYRRNGLGMAMGMAVPLRR